MATRPTVPPRALNDAARAGDADAIAALLKSGADPNAVWRGYRPLHAHPGAAARRAGSTLA